MSGEGENRKGKNEKGTYRERNKEKGNIQGREQGEGIKLERGVGRLGTSEGMKGISEGVKVGIRVNFSSAKLTCLTAFGYKYEYNLIKSIFLFLYITVQVHIIAYYSVVLCWLSRGSCLPLHCAGCAVMSRMLFRPVMMNNKVKRGGR